MFNKSEVKQLLLRFSITTISVTTIKISNFQQLSHEHHIIYIQHQIQVEVRGRYIIVFHMLVPAK